MSSSQARARRPPGRLRVAVLRLGYRLAYRILLLGWPFISPTGRRGVKCLLTNSGRVLLVRHAYGARRVWQLPGGGAHGHESPREAADREMNEELGLEGVSWQELPHDDPRLRRVLPRATFLHGDCPSDRILADPVEIDQARWWPLGELPKGLGAEVKPALALLRKRGEGRRPG